MSVEKEFADKKFKIECSQMVLTKAGGTPLVVRGPGEIWQEEDGAMQYKLFVDRAGYRDLLNHMAKPRVIGQLIPEEDFFTLEAKEDTLPGWSAKQLFPSLRGCGFFEGLAYGNLRELSRSEAHPPNLQNDFVTLRFRSKLEFPCNEITQTFVRIRGQERHTKFERNIAFIDDGDFRFELRHENEHTVVALQLPAGSLTTVTPSRIQEALQFVLGEQLALMVVETTSAGQHERRLMSPSGGSARMSPPLQFRILDEGGHVWRMFSNYFRHTHQDNAAGWHPISRHLHSAIEASAGSLETKVLALAVAVEGLAGDCFPGLAPVDREFIRELDAVQTTVNGLPLSQQTQKRIQGSLNAMRNPRTTDILWNFIETSRIPKELYTSWSRLRHAAAHGAGTGGREIEEILKLRNEVLSLLYSIVFAAINYTGPRTEYSLLNWPNGEWPVAQPPHPAAISAAATQPTAPAAASPMSSQAAT